MKGFGVLKYCFGLVFEIYVNGIAFPSSKQLNFVMGDASGNSGNCCTFSKGVAREPSGIDASIEERLVDCFDKMISGKGAKCSCEQWGGRDCRESIEEGLDGSHWACR